MGIYNISPHVLWVGADDEDRRLFDELIPLPDGTSYNAYIVKGSTHTALIDAVDPTKTEVLFSHLKNANITRIDYIVVNHAEQDHSGALAAVLERYPNARIVTNQKCKEFLQTLLHIDKEVYYEVKDHDTLSLGDVTLRFIMMPWVHWPETMITFLEEEKILFSGDLFGAHFPFHASEKRREHLSVAAKRYYAEIMMPFRKIIQSHLQKVRALQPRMIAPSHGPLHRQPEEILESYTQWTSDRMSNEAIIAYVSMHDSDRIIAYALAEKLREKGVSVHLFNLTKTDTGVLAMALVDAATVIIITPTVLGNPHPVAFSATYLISLLRPKVKYAAILNSYLWGGKTVDTLQQLLSPLSLSMFPPLSFRGLPRQDTYEAIEKLANDIACKHREDQLVIKE